jgi:tRNA pseudouridine55 synthase
MDGLLVVDKPVGPTSHDVVARMRRVLHERRIGHTGTLDPMASGVLPLVVGKATRLARFLSGSDKTYEAVVRLAFATDTGDAQGAPLGSAHQSVLPSLEAIDRALDAFRGTFLQQPPLYSAKKIAGRRSYTFARGQTGVRRRPDPGPDPGLERGPERSGIRPQPAQVTVSRLLVRDVEGDTVTLSLDCSAGFYVRSLAHDLGERLGVGAHLASLRRTRSGQFTLDDAVALAAAERDPEGAARRVVPPARMLANLSSIVLSEEGVRLATHGRDLGPAAIQNGVGSPSQNGTRENGVGSPFPPRTLERAPDPLFIRLLDPSGDLVGIAEPATTPGLLHPLVVLR